MATEACKQCLGSGKLTDYSTNPPSDKHCHYCHGTGLVTKNDPKKYEPPRNHKGSKSNGCLAAGTMISLPDGKIDISDISAGQIVLAYSGGYQGFSDGTVRRVDVHTDNLIWELHVRRKSTPLRLTGNHKVLTSRGWRSVWTISPGDKVATIPGDLHGRFEVVGKVNETEKSEAVYNLIVSPFANFVADGVVCSSYVQLRGLRSAAINKLHILGNLRTSTNV